MTTTPKKPVTAGRTPLTIESIVVRSEGAISCDLSQESVILHVDSGVYFGVDPVGSSIWKMLDKPRPVTEICEGLIADYDIDVAACQLSVLGFLNQLVSKDLVRTT